MKIVMIETPSPGTASLGSMASVWSLPIANQPLLYRHAEWFNGLSPTEVTLISSPGSPAPPANMVQSVSQLAGYPIHCVNGLSGPDYAGLINELVGDRSVYLLPGSFLAVRPDSVPTLDLAVGAVDTAFRGKLMGPTMLQDRSDFSLPAWLMGLQSVHIRTTSDLMVANRLWIAQEASSGLYDTFPGKQVPVKGIRASVHPDAIIHDHCLIGHGAVISEGAEIGPFAVIGNRSVIGKNTRVANAVVESGICIGPNLNLDNMMVMPTGILDSETDTWIRINDPVFLKAV